MERERLQTELSMEEHISVYYRLRDNLVAAAQAARDKAVSYRDFKVGCAVMAWKEGLGEDEYLIRTAGNFTPQKGQGRGHQKRCAERNALEAALTDNPELIIAITSVSKESNTDSPSVAHDVLHPCLDCRQLLRELKSTGVVNDKTVIHCVNDSGEQGTALVEPAGETDIVTAGQEMTLRDLLDLYKDDERIVA